MATLKDGGGLGQVSFGSVGILGTNSPWGAGGLAVPSQDQRLGAMGWQGLTSKAVKEKSGTPLTSTLPNNN